MSNGRKVSTDALETLGTIIGEGEKRDAIHLAVLPMVANEKMVPGQCIQARGDIAVKSTYEKATGIVDPFLPLGPDKGERFWMVLMPRMVTSLRHVWSHPAFEDEPGTSVPSSLARDKSEAWLRAWCARADVPGYDEVMEAAGWAIGDDPIRRGSVHFGTDATGEIPDEFWDHYEVVTGRKVTNRPTFISCAC